MVVFNWGNSPAQVFHGNMLPIWHHLGKRLIKCTTSFMIFRREEGRSIVRRGDKQEPVRKPPDPTPAPGRSLPISFPARAPSPKAKLCLIPRSNFALSLLGTTEKYW